MTPSAEPPPTKGETQSVVPTLLALLVLVPLASLGPWTMSAGLIALCGIYVAFEFALVRAACSSTTSPTRSRSAST